MPAPHIPLSKVVITNSAIKHLDLRHNQIGAEGTAAFAEAISFNQSLQSLGLMSNNIGDAGGMALAFGLAQNEGLLSLDLSQNDIGGKGATALGSSLLLNSTLQVCPTPPSCLGMTHIQPTSTTNKPVWNALALPDAVVHCVGVHRGLCTNSAFVDLPTRM